MMDTNLNNIISENVLRIRICRRFSQKEIASVLGISQTTYHRMESGEAVISAERLLALGRNYEIDMNDFFRNRKPITSASDISIYEIPLLKERLKMLEMANELLNKRNKELEEKIQRKNAKLDELLSEKRTV